MTTQPKQLQKTDAKIIGDKNAKQPILKFPIDSTRGISHDYRHIQQPFDYFPFGGSFGYAE